ncbi:diguanylate cyclase [Desulfobacterales bacterium HSG17]|nr:diguanylate cyclase [Desulfobacterales bacterium HSG17]
MMEKTERILIVDDESHNRKILTNLLKNEYKIMVAKNGAQAINASKGKNRPDLILLDLLMPDMDGYEVFKTLKNEERTMNIPVIFITALDKTANEVKGLELGAVDYITKPINPIIVKTRVKTHMTLKRKTDLLEKMASLDGLTEIPNRRRFDEKLQSELGRAGRNRTALPLILADIDCFKQFNDNYGHAQGDRCLRNVAQSIKKIIKRSSDLAARYGGEEFGIILPTTDLNGALAIAEAIRLTVAALNIPHAYSKAADYVSLSLGVACIEPEKIISSLETSKAGDAALDRVRIELIEAADAALYRAKESGRNQVAG